MEGAPPNMSQQPRKSTPRLANLSLLDEAGIANSTVFLLTSDHGHHPTSGTHSSTLHPVPFFVQGAPIEAAEVTEFARNNQVAPVVAYLLEVPPSSDWNSTVEPFDRYLPGARLEESHVNALPIA